MKPFGLKLTEVWANSFADTSADLTAVKGGSCFAYVATLCSGRKEFASCFEENKFQLQ